jgi:alpha-L-fucosidase
MTRTAALLLTGFLTGTLLAGAEADPRPSAATIQQWQDRKFGMFIHWGLYAIPAGVWNGQRITNGYSEQIQSHAPIPNPDYEKLAAQFNPDKWDAEAVVKLAQQAGMKFIVITAKHHDGFNMFATRQTNYNVVDATPYGKDVVKQLSDACARHGLKFGVYYSTIDWHYPDATTWTEDNNNDIPDKHADFNVRQLRELMTGYGPMSEIWFDMGNPTLAQSRFFAGTVHGIQPECMVSGRVFNHQGDFAVMGDNRIPRIILDEPWQTPASIYGDTWGYRSWQERQDLPGKIDEHILKLAEVAARGGNYLLNIGPRGDGSIVEFEAAVLRGVGAWLDKNGEAIYGARPQPFRQLDFGYATVKGSRLYLLVRNWPADGWLRLPGLKNKIRSAWYLSDRRRTPLHTDVRAESAGGAPAIRVAQHVENAPVTPPLTVVIADLEGAPDVTPPVIRPDAAGAITLTAAQADTWYNYNGGGYYDPPTVYKRAWHFAITRKGRYRVEIFYNQVEPGANIELVVDRRTIVGQIDRSKGSGSVTIGTVDLTPKDAIPLRIAPSPYNRGVRLGLDVDHITLTPVE